MASRTTLVPGRGSALAVSLALHALMFAALVIGVRTAPLVSPPRPVELVLPPHLPLVSGPPRPSPPTASRMAPEPLARPGQADAAPIGRTDEPPAAASRYPSFFRDFIPGCEREVLILLPEAERRRCEARIAVAERRRAGFGAAPTLPLSGLSAQRRAEFDAQVQARENRRRAGMGQPLAPCIGQMANYGAGCIPLEGFD